MLGAAGAIVLRLVMILFANALLDVPLVKLAGAWMLTVIALNVQAHRRDDGDAGLRSGAASDLTSAAVVIMFADAAMSFDNVVALAALARGDIWLLTLGVALSIPILAYGALILTEITRWAPEIMTVGAAFLGWIAGGMATSDPLVAGWIQANAPALAVFAPALLALFVVAAGTGLGRATPQPAFASTAGPLRSIAPVRRPPTFARSASAPVRNSEPRLPIASATDSPEDAVPAFSSDRTATIAGGVWTEERLVVAGFVLLAFLAGLIIFVASFFDSLT
jgi:hypothetical protein